MMDQHSQMTSFSEQGLSWEQAVSLLAQHDYNVARAADAYFSGKTSVGSKDMTWADSSAVHKEQDSSPTPSSTPWTDPFDPSKRIAIKDLCIGLAPVLYGPPYLPSFVQVLFHIPAILQATLSFQPTSSDWGSPRFSGQDASIPWKYGGLPGRYFQARNELEKKANTSISSRYSLDKIIYLDRYLTENKNELRKRYAQAHEWRREIQEAEKAIERSRRISINDRNMKGQVYDRCDVLGMALSYFKESRSEHASIKSLDTMCSIIESRISKQSNDIKQNISILRHNIANLLEDEKLKKKPYSLQSVVYCEKDADHERYWSHIWVHNDKDNGQWYRFSDGDVSKVTEAEVLSEERLPFAITYMDCSVPKLSKSEAKECIPDSLKDFIRMDNDDFEEEIRAYEAMNNLDTNQHYDSSTSLIEDTDAPGALSIPTEPHSPHPGFRSLAEIEKVMSSISILMTAGTGFYMYDPKICKGFEYFLATLQSSEALEIFLSRYTMDHGMLSQGILVVHEQESRNDPYLSTLWIHYDIFSDLAQTMTEALTCFVKRSYGKALNQLVQVKQKEENWKAQLQQGGSSDIGDKFPMLQLLGFNALVAKYGKACLKVLDDIAFDMVSDPIYREQGLMDAIDIAYKAPVVMGMDRLEKNKTFIRMRHRWAEFSISSLPTRTCFEPYQIDLLKRLVAAYFDIGNTTAMYSLQSSSYTNGDLVSNAPQPLSERYQESLIEAASHLRQLKKAGAEAEKSPLVHAM
ncbi:hypothetical protein K492DRAFT_240789 [Lichtheimia hyalospora FSU 10163]|nr:hypothetical protein K492DRAFT_240789 [Lichtheimia hyalospora FSU 10163]